MDLSDGVGQQEREPDADQFRVGDVWETTRGHLYRVVEVRRGGQAILRAGATDGGRIVRKQWDGIGWWRRVSCGAARAVAAERCIERRAG